MGTLLKIIHITDMHIGENDEKNRNIDVRKNFSKVLQAIALDNPPDLIVLGGDLSAIDGELGAYMWIKEEMDQLGIEYMAIPGNHDNAVNLQQVFGFWGKRSNELYFVKEFKGNKVVFLDSSRTSISKSQLQWLSSITKDFQEPFLMFIHHPPLLCGCRFMDDNYPLYNWIDVSNAFSRIRCFKHIFCGHYHTEKTLVNGNMSVSITPSTMMQICQTDIKYNVSGLCPGWRVIEWDGEQLSTSVRYIKP